MSDVPSSPPPSKADTPSKPAGSPRGGIAVARALIARSALGDVLIALSFALVYVVVLLRTCDDLGYARDEGFYFQAAQVYGRWFELLASNPHAAIAPQAVDGAWGVNHEHPGLIKSLFALSNLVLSRKLHLFTMEGTSFRFPAIVLAGSVVGLVYLWGTKARGRLAGASAAILLAAMPRFFYQSHLACFDVPIVTMWTLCAYCYWSALRGGGALWPLLTGITFGLALDTKHNSWFLPIAFCAHAALVQIRIRAFSSHPRARTSGAQEGDERPAAPASIAGRRALTALTAMAIIGPLVFIALWPWIWRDTFARLRGYAMFHLNHEYYNMEFLGRNYWKPPMPRAYAPLMTAATVPVVTLALAACGMFVRARVRLSEPLRALVFKVRSTLSRSAPMPADDAPREPDDLGSTDLLWLLGFAVAYSAWLSSSTPIFGGTKHWMTAYPFLALFAGAGFAAVVRVARGSLQVALRRAPFGPRARSFFVRFARGAALPVALGALVTAAPIVETAHSHPWGLSNYTPLVGGAPGAATLGLNRGFWGFTTGAVVGYLNREVPRGGSVYIHDTAIQAWDMLLRDGRLRSDIRAAPSIATADFGLYHHELHMLGQDYQTWIAFGSAAPDAIAGIDGVPAILVYKRPGLARPGPR